MFVVIILLTFVLKLDQKILSRLILCGNVPYDFNLSH